MTQVLRRYRHGDVVLKGIRKLPEGGMPEMTKPLAFGEVTGHSHRFTGGEYTFWQKGGRRYIKVLETATLVHEEHAPLSIAPGVYEQRAEREFDYTKASTRTVLD